MADNNSERNTDPRDSIGQPESMRNEEERLRDNEGGSELTDRPEARPAGVPGETASAEAEGPPPDRAVDRASPIPLGPGDNADVAAPVRSAGPAETTLPEESPLGSRFQPGGPERADNAAPTEGDAERARIEERLRNTRVEPGGRIVPPEERGE